MKNILLLLFFFGVSLLGVKDIESALLSEEGVGVESVLQAETSEELLATVTELPKDSDTFVDMESLACQCRIIGRGHRSFSVQQMLWGKNPAYRASRKRLETLLHTINHVYTSLPCQSWLISSDHYIFELRHILI